MTYFFSRNSKLGVYETLGGLVAGLVKLINEFQKIHKLRDCMRYLCLVMERGLNFLNQIL